jgi:hypothetical protein
MAASAIAGWNREAIGRGKEEAEGLDGSITGTAATAIKFGHVSANVTRRAIGGK